MDVIHACAEAQKSFPNARAIYLGTILWGRLLQEVTAEPNTKIITIDKAHVLHDPALKPGEMEVVRVPDVWDFPQDEKKPRRKPTSVQKRKKN